MDVRVDCIICGDPIYLTKQEARYDTSVSHAPIYKVCPPCRSAVLRMKRMMIGKQEGNHEDITTFKIGESE